MVLLLQKQDENSAAVHLLFNSIPSVSRVWDCGDRRYHSPIIGNKELISYSLNEWRGQFQFSRVKPAKNVGRRAPKEGINKPPPPPHFATLRTDHRKNAASFFLLPRSHRGRRQTALEPPAHRSKPPLLPSASLPFPSSVFCEHL